MKFQNASAWSIWNRLNNDSKATNQITDILPTNIISQSFFPLIARYFISYTELILVSFDSQYAGIMK